MFSHSNLPKISKVHKPIKANPPVVSEMEDAKNNGMGK